MKIVTIVGARPQFIKAAVISRLVADRSGLDEVLVHTGQHYDAAMSDVFFGELDLPRPQRSLGVGSASHGVQTGRMLAEIERVLLEESPEAVLVYGDTNSTLAGALAAAKLHIPVGHVEAGLRSFDRSMPEEVNRVVTDHLSTWHFCPTEAAVAHLRREGLTTGVFEVGDVMSDALLYYGKQDDARPGGAEADRHPSPYALCTLHRAGNTDDPARFRRLWNALLELSREIEVVLPIHPRTRSVVQRLGLHAEEGLCIIDPVGYREMLALERRAQLIVTDSGGVQKEAYMQAVPCVTLRDNTEWTETVEAGWNVLVGCDRDALLAAARRFLEHGPPTNHPALYGDGNAGQRILDVLLRGTSTNRDGACEAA